LGVAGAAGPPGIAASSNQAQYDNLVQNISGTTGINYLKSLVGTQTYSAAALASGNSNTVLVK
jgi:hypothetical protein